MLDKGQSVFINNANLIKKLSFPKICLPIIVTLSAVLKFRDYFQSVSNFIIVTGNFPGWSFSLGDTGPAFADPVCRWAGDDPWCHERLFSGMWGNWVSVALQFWFWFTPHCLCTEFITCMGKKSDDV